MHSFRCSISFSLAHSHSLSPDIRLATFILERVKKKKMDRSDNSVEVRGLKYMVERRDVFLEV